MQKIPTATLFIITTYSVFGQAPIDSIKAIIKQEVANKRSKSIIVGIVDSTGRQIISAGVMSDKNPIHPDENTIYEIGSITKTFTGLLLAEMSFKKELNYNDPISKFLPKTVKTPVRNGKEITLLNLAVNRSGLPRKPFNLDPKN
ncbi:MAG: serine hydrolase [Ignavibacteriae bacterium]|nr:serine hydrolase [Ignavibacteriota bacterium]